MNQCAGLERLLSIGRCGLTRPAPRHRLGPLLPPRSGLTGLRADTLVNRCRWISSFGLGRATGVLDRAHQLQRAWQAVISMRGSVHKVCHGRRLVVLVLCMGAIVTLVGCSAVVGEDTVGTTTTTTTTAPAVTFSGSEASGDEVPASASRSETTGDAPTNATTATDSSVTTEHTDTPSSTPTTATTPTTQTTTAPGPVPDGSGCTPGERSLRDGRWFGFAQVTYPDSLDFDLACRFSDENASLAQVEDGESPLVYDDYFIRNNNPAIRTLAVNPDVPVAWHPRGDPRPEQTVYAQWADQGNRYFGIWITIEGGQVTGINEQWGP